MRNSALISETWHVFLFYRKELIWNEVDNMTVCVDLNFPSAKALQIKITISSLLFSVIPLCIVIPSNVAIIIKLFLHKKHRRSLHASCSNTETTKITVMLLSVTVAYIVLLVPTTISIILFRLGEFSYNTLILLSNLPYLNMSLNFYLYFLSGNMFRNEFKQLMRRYYSCLTSADKFVSNREKTSS